MTTISSLSNGVPTPSTDGSRHVLPPRSPWGGGMAVASGSADLRQAGENPFADTTPPIVAELLNNGWERVPVGDNSIVWVFKQ